MGAHIVHYGFVESAASTHQRCGELIRDVVWYLECEPLVNSHVLRQANKGPVKNASKACRTLASRGRGCDLCKAPQDAAVLLSPAVVARQVCALIPLEANILSSPRAAFTLSARVTNPADSHLVANLRTGGESELEMHLW